jgi:hypothetical protein
VDLRRAFVAGGAPRHRRVPRGGVSDCGAPRGAGDACRRHSLGAGAVGQRLLVVEVRVRATQACFVGVRECRARAGRGRARLPPVGLFACR